MVYRAFGKTGVKVSPLGFGMMRLPAEEEKSIEMVRYAIDNGVNYIDTAYNYLDGNSELITGRALADGYREKVYLATKMPVWLIGQESDFDRILEEQLTKLGTDHIDFYLLHALNQDTWKNKVLQHRLIGKMKEAKAAGKVRFIGFSFHDSPELFREIVDACPDWDFCQIQLNYLDVYYQAGIQGLRYARERGLGVIVMEPLRGGYLASVPREVAEIFDTAEALGLRGRTAVEWALDYLWNMPEVGVVLSGMSTLQQAMDNVAYAARSAPGMLCEAEQQVVEKAYQQFLQYNAVPCTGCSYCISCPQNIAIPQRIAAYNEYFKEHNFEKAKSQYGAQASACISCRACEKICPQHIEISRWMREIDAFFNREEQPS